MTIGDRIRARRIELGLLQEFVARKVGVTPVTMCSIEHNRVKRPAPEIIVKLADVLNTTTDYLLRDQTEGTEQ